MLLRLVKSPSMEVAAAIVVVLIAAWVVIQTEVDLRPHKARLVVPFALK
jgi:ABC-type nickel/cobalt efflux system permease component RcnA